MIDAAAGELSLTSLAYLVRVRLTAAAKQLLEEVNAAVSPDLEDRDTAIAELNTSVEALRERLEGEQMARQAVAARAACL